MLIEHVFPHVVGATASLQDRLAAEGRNAEITPELVDEIVSALPLKILNSECFFDRMTSVWRYEFGLPRRVGGNQLLWGTHMWTPVTILLRVLRVAHQRLSAQQRRRYLERLADLEKHEDVLSEFLPVARLADEVSAEFGHLTGAGGRDVDWRIRAAGHRPVLVEVKNRMRDLLEVADRVEAGERDPDGTAPAPIHNVAILFRGVEDKFRSVEPDEQLQGAWIATDLQQEEVELATAFAALDSTKVHYIILGDWAPGIAVLTRRAADRTMLVELFREQDSGRFTFRRGESGRKDR
jgi:hypothetical protein